MKKNTLKYKESSVEQKIKDTLILYFKGQLIVVLLNSVVFSLFLYFFNVKYALFLGVLTGALSVIPTLGILSTALLTFIVSVLDNQEFFGISPLYEGLILLLVYFIFNQIVDFIISPLIIGKAVRVSPVILFLSVIVGTLLFGLLGTFLAVPAVLVLRELYENNKK